VGIYYPDKNLNNYYPTTDIYKIFIKQQKTKLAILGRNGESYYNCSITCDNKLINGTIQILYTCPTCFYCAPETPSVQETHNIICSYISTNKKHFPLGILKCNCLKFTY